MSETMSDTQQTSTAKKKPQGRSAAPPPKAPVGMSTNDHTALVDLLLQQTALSAKLAVGITEPKALLRAAGHAVLDTRQALAAYTMPGSGTSPRKLFTSVDAAFMGLYDLYFVLRDHLNAGASGYAPEVQAAMVDLNARFGPLGWSVPKSDAEGHTRARAAGKVGAANLTTNEKGRLGRLHLRAARQYILGDWQDIAGGKLNAITHAATHNLRDALSLLIDPHLSSEIDAIAGEVAVTDQVLGRLFMFLQSNNPTAIGSLRELAKNMDALRALVGHEAQWTTKVTAIGPAPTAKQPAPTNATGQGPAATTSNEVDRGAPRAEPGMHRIGETRHFTKKVHLKDTNYTDEYLGYIELFMEAYKTPSGQVYVQRAKAIKRLEDRAGEYLSVGADVVANSIELNGQHFCDVFFDVQIGGPNKTETTTVNASLKASAGNEGKTAGAEASAGVVFSTSVSSQGTRAFRRVYRIAGLNKPIQLMQYDPQDPYRPKLVDIGIVENERKDLHQDFSGFELDDDDVGDSVTSFYANWVLNSYGD